MNYDNLIFSSSGIRGIVGRDLDYSIVKKIAIAFSLWLKRRYDDLQVIIGRDTRISGEIFEKAIKEGLLINNCKIINLGICPSPVLVYTKKRLNIPAGIIISGSHNPPEWNALKLLSKETFLNESQIKEISIIIKQIFLDKYNKSKVKNSKLISELNPFPNYTQAVYNNLNYKNIINQNNLKVAIDTGAGAGKYVTPELLETLGCKIILVNNEFNEKNEFPRDLEPIERNLSALIDTIKNEQCDIGFAHDCDADRLTIIGDDSRCYTEDIGLALIADYIFKNYSASNKNVIFVTNLASSLMFEALTEKYDVKIIRTPIGERYLAEKMNSLIQKYKKDYVVFGGEGSSGGVMFPHFNNTRDGIFAAAKIIEIIIESNEKVSTLISKLPKFYSYKWNFKIDIKQKAIIMNKLKEYLISEEELIQIDNDLRISDDKEFLVLIHPSNTESIIRVKIEAKKESLVSKYRNKIMRIIELIHD